MITSPAGLRSITNWTIYTRDEYEYDATTRKWLHTTFPILINISESLCSPRPSRIPLSKRSTSNISCLFTIYANVICTMDDVWLLTKLPSYATRPSCWSIKYAPIRPWSRVTYQSLSIVMNGTRIQEFVYVTYLVNDL